MDSKQKLLIFKAIARLAPQGWAIATMFLAVRNLVIGVEVRSLNGL
jgi:hypothetical protein